jgi:hypothetical protein
MKITRSLAAMCVAWVVALFLLMPAKVLATTQYPTGTAGESVGSVMMGCFNGTNWVPATTGGQCLGSGGGSSSSAFSPAGGSAFGSLTATASASASTALPTNTGTVEFRNANSVDVSCTFAVGTATGAVNNTVLPANSTRDIGVGSNTQVSCINQTGSASNPILMAGGSGGLAGFGGAGSSGSGGNVNLTQILGAAPSATNPLWMSPATGATFPISAASLPLPTNAATSINQGATTDAPCTIPASATACSEIAIGKAIANTANAPAKIVDNGGTNVATVKAASTPAAATDTAIVVDQRPGTTVQVQSNSANLATAANQITGTQYGNQANWLNGAASQTGTTATTILAAGTNKWYVKSVQCSRDDAGTTAMRVTFNDGATTPMLLPNNGGGGANNATFDPPLTVTSATAFQFTPSTAITTVRCSAQAYNAP